MKTSDANYGNKKTGESIPSINPDWLTAGFARFQPAGYVKR